MRKPSVAGTGGRDPDRLYSTVVRHMGGKRLWPHLMANRLDVHAAIVLGIPYGVLAALIGSLKQVPDRDIAAVLGISERTLRRRRREPDARMPAHVASKAWFFAEMLVIATAVFGGASEAERWMTTPVADLDHARPIDLLQTFQGAGLVDEYLIRLANGVCG